ncbi:MAG TPA: dicarboxylate/amino acid:cation symporter, partial [Candidatus Ventrisoma faecale]|nr:dicarboxylate/amino acid:cation symporter [Candidatus Ventrisoma faecale]
MGKIFKSLPFKLLVGVFAGIVVGLMAGEGLMNVVVTLNYIMGQLVSFCVPLIIIGFIAPSITKLGNNASRMLGIALVLAYVSSIGAAFFSMAAGYTIIPGMSIDTNVEGLRELPGIVFELQIPQIMPVMSALVFSVLIGLSATWT